VAISIELRAAERLLVWVSRPYVFVLEGRVARVMKAVDQVAPRLVNLT
jgi:hypothetical protein